VEVDLSPLADDDFLLYHGDRLESGTTGYGAVAFVDETLPSIRERRWLKVPLARLAQAALRLIVRAATREELTCLSPSFYVGAWRP